MSYKYDCMSTQINIAFSWALTPDQFNNITIYSNQLMQKIDAPAFGLPCLNAFEIYKKPYFNNILKQFSSP